MINLCITSIFLLKSTLNGKTSVDACEDLKALEKPRRCGVLMRAFRLFQSSLIHRAMIPDDYEPLRAARTARIN